MKNSTVVLILLLISSLKAQAEVQQLQGIDKFGRLCAISFQIQSTESGLHLSDISMKTVSNRSRRTELLSDFDSANLQQTKSFFSGRSYEYRLDESRPFHSSSKKMSVVLDSHSKINRVEVLYKIGGDIFWSDQEHFVCTQLQVSKDYDKVTNLIEQMNEQLRCQTGTFDRTDECN